MISKLSTYLTTLPTLRYFTITPPSRAMMITLVIVSDQAVIISNHNGAVPVPNWSSLIGPYQVVTSLLEKLGSLKYQNNPELLS